MCQTHRYLQQQKKVTIMMMMIVIIIIHLDKDLTTNVKNWYWIVWCDLCVNVYDNDDHIMFELWYQKKRKYWVVKSKVIRSFFCYCIFHCSWNTYRAKRQYYCLFFVVVVETGQITETIKLKVKKCYNFHYRKNMQIWIKEKPEVLVSGSRIFFCFGVTKLQSPEIYMKKKQTPSQPSIWLGLNEKTKLSFVLFVCLFVSLRTRSIFLFRFFEQ